MYAITNEDKTLFLGSKRVNGVRGLAWVINLESAFHFESEQDAARFEKIKMVSDFLNFEGKHLSHINKVS